jgi:cell filamentation protein
LDESTYVYPGTTILKNKLDIRDKKKLDQWERLMTAKRHLQLMARPLSGSFDLAHLQRIHKHLFQDVYEWAGQIRKVVISKPPTLFCLPRMIESEADRIFGELRDERYLTRLDAQNFAERAAYYLSEINVLHPFREGNGRTQREFIRCLGLKSGYVIDWAVADKDDLKEAMVEAAIKSEEKLAEIILTCIVNRK